MTDKTYPMAFVTAPGVIEFRPYEASINDLLQVELLSRRDQSLYRRTLVI